MSKFAKLFDVEDTQVLYVLDEDDEGFPGVRIRTSVEGIIVQLTPTYRSEDEDENWNKAEAAFALIGQADADAFFANASAMIRSVGE